MNHSRSCQKTVKGRVRLAGIGVHNGQPTSVTIRPAGPDTGIRFLRTGMPGLRDVEIPAQATSVGSTELCTVLGDPGGVFIATVEHLLAALVGLGVDNALVAIHGTEVPVMDGSAAEFVKAIDEVGLAAQKPERKLMRIQKPVRVEMGSSFAEFQPYDGCRYEISVDYPCPFIGAQAVALDLSPESFRAEIAAARTFGHTKDVQRLWAAGFALGSSLENSIIIGEKGIMNSEGLRFPDEFARHKLLDAIGDLALAGAPIRGLYRSYRGGHRVNAMAVAALLSQPDAWILEPRAADREARGESRAELLAGMLSPVFAPEVS